MWPPSIPISAAILCSAAARRMSAAVVASIRSFGWRRAASRTQSIRSSARFTAGGPVTSLGTQIEKNSASRPPSRMRGTSMCPSLWRAEMSNVLSKSIRCGVSSCESITIARSCSWRARGEIGASGGGAWARSVTAATASGTAAVSARMTYLMRAMLIHSYRRAIIGSTRSARRAGT